jgi:hypothetical protein
MARIPVFASDLVGFDVDREPLLDQVKQAFVQITQNQVDNAYNEILIRKF